ncbi:MAG: SAM-dependent methyltransferase, partial [Waterburya sp.]
ELLDPSLTHYEFFLAKPPLAKQDWSSDEILNQAIPECHPCMQGFPSKTFFDFEFQMANLSDEEYEFMLACEKNQDKTVKEILANCQLDLAGVRSLFKRQLIILSSIN